LNPSWLRPEVAVLLLVGLLGCSPPPPLPKGQGGPLATPGLLGTPLPDIPGTPAVSQILAGELPPVPPVVERQTEPVPTEVGELARQLVATVSGEREKAQALYDWIARNIRYDIVAYRSGNLPDPSPELVLAQRMGVCEGYARLFLAMAEAVGLEAVMVPGYAKGFAPNQDQSRPDHAWNAVKIDGEWVLLDVTWGSGHIAADKSFQAEFEPFWFATPPEEFAVTHLPVEDRWQLLSSPVDTATFWARPSLGPTAFEYQLSLDSHPRGRIESDGPLEMNFSTGREARLMAALYQGDSPLPGTHALVERQGRNFTVSVRPPEPGEYRLIIFAGPIDQLEAQSAVTYQLTARSGQPEEYPKTMRTFADQEVRLLQPRTGLRAGEAAQLLLEAPGASAMMAVIGEEQYPFERDGDRFSLQLVPSGVKVGVFGSYNDSPRYDGLLEFPVAP
jgi:hypothetical protein